APPPPVSAPVAPAPPPPAPLGFCHSVRIYGLCTLVLLVKSSVPSGCVPPVGPPAPAGLPKGGNPTLPRPRPLRWRISLGVSFNGGFPGSSLRLGSSCQSPLRLMPCGGAGSSLSVAQPTSDIDTARPAAVAPSREARRDL